MPRAAAFEAHDVHGADVGDAIAVAAAAVGGKAEPRGNRRQGIHADIARAGPAGVAGRIDRGGRQDLGALAHGDDIGRREGVGPVADAICRQVAGAATQRQHHRRIGISAATDDRGLLACIDDVIACDQVDRRRGSRSGIHADVQGTRNTCVPGLVGRRRRERFSTLAHGRDVRRYQRVAPVA